MASVHQAFSPYMLGREDPVGLAPIMALELSAHLRVRMAIGARGNTILSLFFKYYLNVTQKSRPLRAW